MKINVIPVLQRVKGVGDVMSFGGDYEVVVVHRHGEFQTLGEVFLHDFNLCQAFVDDFGSSIDAMSEIGTAIISITLVMMLVFIPVSRAGR